MVSRLEEGKVYFTLSRDFFSPFSFAVSPKKSLSPVTPSALYRKVAYSDAGKCIYILMRACRVSQFYLCVFFSFFLPPCSSPCFLVLLLLESCHFLGAEWNNLELLSASNALPNVWQFEWKSRFLEEKGLWMLKEYCNGCVYKLKMIEYLYPLHLFLLCMIRWNIFLSYQGIY